MCGGVEKGGNQTEGKEEEEEEEGGGGGENDEKCEPRRKSAALSLSLSPRC